MKLTLNIGEIPFRYTKLPCINAKMLTVMEVTQPIYFLHLNRASCDGAKIDCSNCSFTYTYRICLHPSAYN